MAPKRKAKADNADGAAPAPKMSAYQAYVKEALARVKALNPSLGHDAAFRMVAAGWKQHPTNPKRAETDWRTPLFYWRGAIDGDTWSGTWVASADGLPSDADFAASENTFTLKCSAELGKSMSSPATLAGSYKLDQGDGLADFSDISHEVYAMMLVLCASLVNMPSPHASPLPSQRTSTGGSGFESSSSAVPRTRK